MAYPRPQPPRRPEAPSLPYDPRSLAARMDRIEAKLDEILRILYGNDGLAGVREPRR